MPDALQAAKDRPIREQYEGKFGRNTLTRKVESNSIGALIFRADYELRWLRQAKKARCYWTLFLGASGIKKALKGLPAEHQAIAEAIMQNVQLAKIASHELREWCERERALLRIAKPAAQVVKVGKHADRLDRDATPTLVDVEQVQSDKSDTTRQ